jgi:hypothetical protein
VVRIRGILFFGTPHKIVPADAENSPVAKIAQLNDRDIETIDVAALSQVCETFIIESAKALETKFVSFHETKPTAPSNNIVSQGVNNDNPKADNVVTDHRPSQSHHGINTAPSIGVRPSRHECFQR